MPRLNPLLLLACAFLLLAGCSQRPKLTVDELQDHTKFLASDALKGRQPGSPEDLIAATYIKKNITADNVQFLGQDGFQKFEIVSSVELGADNRVEFGGAALAVQKDYMPFAFSQNGAFNGAVVFVGYGFAIHTDGLTWDDYAGLETTGKWVMVLRGDPDPDNPNSPFAVHSGLRKKVFVAQDHGAAGVIFVNGPAFDAKDELPALVINDSHITAGLPVIQLKKEQANELLAAHNTTIDSLETLLNSQRKPHSFASDVTLNAVIDVQRIKKNTQNVVALLPGSDPVLKGEYVVIGAHYDHLGFGGPGSGSRRPDTLAIHNGADDNASGTGAAIELFEKLAANQAALKRSVLFVAFGAEEMGTIGSKYFIDNPLVDIKRIKFMFNLDMVGRLQENALTLNGTGTAIGMEEMLQSHAGQHQLKLSMAPEGLGPSDHAPFYAADIPVLMFFTGIHDDYHTPGDDANKINYAGEKRIADFAYDVIVDVANRQEMLVFQEAGPKERNLSRRQYKVTLGIMPDVAGVEQRGLRVDAVMPDRPAQRAGLLKGDIIVAIEGKPVKDVYEYMHRLTECQVGQRISVEVLRGEEKVILIVEL